MIASKIPDIDIRSTQLKTPEWLTPYARVFLRWSFYLLVVWLAIIAVLIFIIPFLLFGGYGGAVIGYGANRLQQ